jgi:TubC N-terminal docking domain
MNAVELITELRSLGVALEAEGDRLRIEAPKGAVTPELREALTASKDEVIRLLALRRQSVTVSESVGPCPHCGSPLLVSSHPLKDEICVQCPTRPNILKFIKIRGDESTPMLCSDCATMPAFITGRCPECIQRLLLCPDEACEKCGSSRYWRHRANENQPPGFKWYCARCTLPSTRNVAWYELANSNAIS